jgi:hypothetical protein
MLRPSVDYLLPWFIDAIKADAAQSNFMSADQPFCGYHAISFPSVTQVLPSAILRAVWY